MFTTEPDRSSIDAEATATGPSTGRPKRPRVPFALPPVRVIRSSVDPQPTQGLRICSNECLSVLRITICELWKQDVDRIDLGDDMTDDHVAAETVDVIDSLSQRFVRCCAEVNANQNGSLELHRHSRIERQRPAPLYRATAYAETLSTRSILAVADLPWSTGFRG